jgi:site-specific DNA-methyltransferase (adenine-specific)
MALSKTAREKAGTRTSDSCVLEGDSAEVIKTLDENSFDSIVCDPPAGISFFGQKWDGDKGGRDQWIAWLAGLMHEGLRVLKPGGHALVWALPRTSHWTGMALELAGFEVRERITHMFSSGYPKSPNIGKMLAGQDPRGRKSALSAEASLVAPGEMSDAERWLGWGTSLKPAGEDWWLARKPPSEKLISANVVKWGTGALNITGTKIAGVMPNAPSPRSESAVYSVYGWGKKKLWEDPLTLDPAGRWPSNVVLSHSDECQMLGVKNVTKTDERQALIPGCLDEPGAPETVEDWRCVEGCAVRLLNEQGAEGPPRRRLLSENGGAMDLTGGRDTAVVRADYLKDAEVSRFFYCAKANNKERWGYCATCDVPVHYDERAGHVKAPHELVVHPTQKSEDLMRYFIRLITPPGGRVLDPFGGSGTTLVAALSEGFSATVIERDPQFVKIARARHDDWRVG